MAKPLGELVPRILQQAAAKRETVQRLQHSWPRLVGRRLAAHTRPGGIRRGTLTIYTDEPGTNFLLMLEKPRLLERLKAEARCGIEEVVIRPGDLG
jgi:hypothetical protein